VVTYRSDETVSSQLDVGMRVYWHQTLIAEGDLPAAYVNLLGQLKVIANFKGSGASTTVCPVNWFLVYEKPT
jgi:hypothetical protein